MYVGKQIHELRKSCKIIQYDLARAMHKDQMHISGLETNYDKIGLLDLVNLTNVCHITISDFLKFNFSSCYFSPENYIRRDDELRKILLGITIQKYREVQNLSRCELAKAVYICEDSIRSYEKGIHIPKVITLMNISSVLGTDIDTILGPFKDGISHKALREIIYKSL